MPETYNILSVPKKNKEVDITSKQISAHVEVPS